VEKGIDKQWPVTEAQLSQLAAPNGDFGGVAGQKSESGQGRVVADGL
jgi:hypothetical protein